MATKSSWKKSTVRNTKNRNEQEVKDESDPDEVEDKVQQEFFKPTSDFEESIAASTELDEVSKISYGEIEKHTVSGDSTEDDTPPIDSESDWKTLNIGDSVHIEMEAKVVSRNIKADPMYLQIKTLGSTILLYPNNDSKLVIVQQECDL
jgi:hypothetical protein